MTRKHQTNELRKRKKSNNYNNNAKQDSNDRIETHDGEKKEMNGKVSMNGTKLNGIERIDDKVKSFSLVQNMSRSFFKMNFLNRLGWMLRELKINWLKQIYKKKDEVPKAMNENSRMAYFQRGFIFWFLLAFTLGIATRLYKIDEPPHVW